MPETRDRRATVVGGGIAALTCASLLVRAGWDVELSQAGTRPVPAMVLGSETVELLESIWAPLRLAGHAVRRRVVRWGAAPAAEMPHRGLVVDGAALIARLEQRCHAARVAVVDEAPDAERWVLLAQGRAVPGRTRQLGRRVVLQARVALRPGADEHVTRMETAGAGWVFLIPTGRGEAVVQAMVPEPPADPSAALSRLLDSTREIEGRLSHVASEEVAVIRAAPQARDPLASPGCLAVGDAARALDPLAGDGTGQGVRSALLATAVLTSIADGIDQQSALDHYAHRTQLSFLRHLVHCLRLYGDAFGTSPAWQLELAALHRELSDPANRALAARPFTHRLANGRIEPMMAHAPTPSSI